MGTEMSAEYVQLMEQVAQELGNWTFNQGWTFSISTESEILTGPLDVGTLVRPDGAKIWTCFDRDSGCIEAVGYVEVPQLDNCPNTKWTDSVHVWLSEPVVQIADALQRTLLPRLEELVVERHAKEECMAVTREAQLEIVQQLTDAALKPSYIEWSDAYGLYLRNGDHYVRMQVPISGIGVKVDGNIPASVAIALAEAFKAVE